MQTCIRFLWMIGIAKVAGGAVAIFTAGILLSADAIDRSAGLGLIALGSAVALAGHALCQGLALHALRKVAAVVNELPEPQPLPCKVDERTP